MAREFGRTDRVAQAIHKELAQIIQQQMKDPRVGIITVAGVKVSKDFAHAKVYVSVMSEEHAKETINTLNKAAGFLRATLAKRIKIRVMPSLSFVYDDTTIKANRLSKLIDDACGQDKQPPEDTKESE